MIKLESTKMQKAIAKSKTMKPRVRMTAERTYSVSGSQGAAYTVHFALAKDAQGNTVRLGECTCLAGRQEMMCYHIAAAAAVNIAIHTMRKAAATQAAPAPAEKPTTTTDERPALIADIKVAWHRARPFESLEGAVRQVFGVTKLEDVSTDDLRRVLVALAPPARRSPARTVARTIVVQRKALDACTKRRTKVGIDGWRIKRAAGRTAQGWGV